MTIAPDAPSRPILRWHGGKFRLREWIISHFPAHRVYIEPYGGAGSVLLAKPRAYAEVWNDLDGEVVNLFRCLREPLCAFELKRRLEYTPYAREEFELAYEPTEDLIERARRLVVRAFMGFGSAAHNPAHRTGFRGDSNRSGTTPAQDWMHFPKALEAFTGRLRGVMIESRPAGQVIAQYDEAHTLHYVDPPYPHGTRHFKERPTGQVYTHELTDADHVALAAVLRQARGMVVLSGYPCAMYDELYAGWECVTRKAYADGAKERTECLWLNPATSAALCRSQPSLELE